MRDAQDADVLAGRSPAPAASAPDASSGSSVDLGFLGALRRAIAVAAAVVVVDQLTKWWAIERLSTGPCGNPDGCFELLAGIRLRLVFNTGAAFTAGSGYGPVLAVLAIVMTVVLLTMSARRPDRAGAVLLAVIAGGAVGNLIDRIFRAEDGVFSGAVIDFIDLGWWPVFNLADSAIVVGVAAVVVVAFFDGRSGAGETEGEKVRPSRRPGETVG